MKPIVRALALFAVVLALIWATFGHANAGSIPLLGAGKPGTVAAAYQGPGDVVSGATFWGGLRAYSAATRGNAAVNVCNVSDVACVDMFTDATTGALIVTSVGGSNCAAVTCTVKILYDQSGSSHNVSTATIANRPVFTLNCIGTLPCMTFASASSQVLTSSVITGIWGAQPDTVSVVAIRPTYGGIDNGIAGDDNTLAMQFGAANQVKLYSGSVAPPATANDGFWHSLQFVVNGASSDINVNGTANTVNAGSSVPSGHLYIGVESQAGTRLDGSITQLGVWNVTFSGANSSAISSQDQTYWGYP